MDSIEKYICVKLEIMFCVVELYDVRQNCRLWATVVNKSDFILIMKLTPNKWRPVESDRDLRFRKYVHVFSAGLAC
jgi:hypothetical protein